MQGVFIVGTGRSGTHFAARLMNGFEHAYDPMGGKEKPDILNDLAKAAIHHRLPSKSTELYYRRLLEKNNGILLDQHHPNLFFVKHWASLFRGLVFLYPKRPTYQIVASMLRHEGVMGWYKYARRVKQRTFNRVPYPNRFLGLRKFSDLNELPAHLLCAHRVIAHRAAFESIVVDTNGALRDIDYEALVEDPLAEFSRVLSSTEMEELGPFTLVEEPNKISLTKYRDVLSDEEVADIVALEN